MKKHVFGRRFKKDKNQRKALFKSLISSLVIEGRIKTTEAKAKAIKAEVDKLVTKGKKGESARRLISGSIAPNAIDKFMLVVVPSFKNRQGGYTRIIRSGARLTDGSSMVIMEWVEGETIEMPKKEPKTKKPAEPAKKTTKKPVAKKPVKKETKNVRKSK